jgi:hypothetical protein
LRGLREFISDDSDAVIAQMKLLRNLVLVIRIKGKLEKRIGFEASEKDSGFQSKSFSRRFKLSLAGDQFVLSLYASHVRQKTIDLS